MRTFNETAPIRHGGRKAIVDGTDHLNFDTDDIENIDSIRIYKDLKKYQFDLENCECVETRTTNNDLKFLVYEAGGDWEYPLYFFIYYDGKELRGYVPTRGNAVNTLNKCAFGNGNDNEYKGINADKAYCDKFHIRYDKNDEYFDINNYIDNIDKDLYMCIDEFENRLEVTNIKNTHSTIMNFDKFSEQKKQ